MYIYIGTAASPKILDYCKTKSRLDSSFVQQKWDYFFCKAFSKIKGEHFKAISFQPVPVFPYGKAFRLKQNHEVVDSLHIEYIGCSNLPIFKQLSSSNNLFKLLVKTCKKNDDVVIITHCLYPQTYKAIKRLKKKFKNFTIVSFVPDLPEFSYPIWGKKHKFLFYLWKIFNKSKLKIKSLPDAYICFAKTQMELLEKKPFMELNGIIDLDYIDSVSPYSNLLNCCDKKIFLYAGTINDDYGIKELINGFIKFNNPNYELHFYGTGNYVDELNKCTSNGVLYKGAVGAREIISLEKSAFMLINPRPPKADYSKYSFPSKILEYMCTKTPILTTSLVTLNKSYQNLMLFAGNGTADEFCDAFVKIDNLDNDQLKMIANRAYDFVSKNLKSDIQALKINKFCQEIRHNGTKNF